MLVKKLLSLINLYQHEYWRKFNKNETIEDNDTIMMVIEKMKNNNDGKKILGHLKNETIMRSSKNATTATTSFWKLLRLNVTSSGIEITIAWSKKWNWNTK